MWVQWHQVQLPIFAYLLHHQTHKAGSFEKADLIYYMIGVGHCTCEVSVSSRKLNIFFQKHFLHTEFPRIVSAETILFWKRNVWNFSCSFRIMTTFYFINWVVAAEYIEGGKIFKGGNYLRKYGIQKWNRNLAVF